MKFTSHCTHNR